MGNSLEPVVIYSDVPLTLLNNRRMDWCDNIIYDTLRWWTIASCQTDEVSIHSRVDPLPFEDRHDFSIEMHDVLYAQKPTEGHQSLWQALYSPWFTWAPGLIFLKTAPCPVWIDVYSRYFWSNLCSCRCMMSCFQDEMMYICLLFKNLLQTPVYYLREKFQMMKIKKVWYDD